MSDYDSRQRKHNIIVGLFVLLAFGAFIAMIFIFGELPVAVSRLRSFTVLVNFPDVSGVHENTSVQYCGYQIGRVTNVSPPFLFKDPGTGSSFHQVKVSLAIENIYVDIPHNVEVKLMKRGLGSSYIKLLAPEVPSRKVLKHEDILQGSTGVSSEFVPPAVQKKLEELVNSVSMLANNANEILGDSENKENIKMTLGNIADASAQATTTLKSLQELSDSGSARLADTAEQMQKVLGQIRQLIAKINAGEGAVGRVVNDANLYENLLDSSQELQMALEQLKILAAEAREKGIKIKL